MAMLVRVLAGAAPGLILLALTIPVDGEAELTLGALGAIAAVLGAGAAALTARRPR